MKFNSLIPELSVTNIEKSKEFYLNLGLHFSSIGQLKNILVVSFTFETSQPEIS